MTAGGFPHSEILGSKPSRRLPEAYRGPSRPSSVLSAKASTIRPCKQHPTPNKEALSMPQEHQQTPRQQIITLNDQQNDQTNTLTTSEEFDRNQQRDKRPTKASRSRSRPLSSSQTTHARAKPPPPRQGKGRTRRARTHAHDLRRGWRSGSPKACPHHSPTPRRTRKPTTVSTPAAPPGHPNGRPMKKGRSHRTTNVVLNSP